MPQKTILTAEEKIKIVEGCLSGEDTMEGSAKKYGVGFDSVRRWVRLYQSRGIEGLIPTATPRKYAIETKKSAVEDYLTGKYSLLDICKKYDITQHSMLQKWIIWYNSHGDFKRPNSGGESRMAKGRKTTLNERIEIVGHCIANNKYYDKTIEKYNVSYSQIYGWVRKYEQNGVDALTDKRGKCKDESEMSEVEKLKAQLKLKESENLRLQMKNELLKKLAALERGIDAN